MIWGSADLRFPEKAFAAQVGNVIFVISHEGLGEKCQLVFDRFAGIEQIRTNQGHKGKKAEVFAPMWCPCEKNQGLKLICIMQFLDQSVCKGHTSIFIEV